MSFDYAELATLSQELLAEFGADATLSHVTQGAYDTASGTKASTSVDSTRKVAIFDFGSGVTQHSGNLVEQGDKMALMDSLGIAPGVADSVTFGAVKFSILSMQEVNPAGTPVIYTLHLRR